MNEQEWKSKLQELKARVVNEPSNGEAFYQLARFYDKECNLPHKALAAYRRVQELLPEQDLQLFIGKAVYTTGDFETGIRMLEGYLCSNQTAHGLCILADCLIKQERYNEAIVKLESALEMDSFFEETYFLLGETLRKSDRQKAITYYLKAISIDPDYVLALREIGSLLLQDEKSASKGVEYLQKAFKLNPDEYWTNLYLANGYWKIGDLINADVLYRKATEIEPGDELAMQSYRVFRNSIPLLPIT